MSADVESRVDALEVDGAAVAVALPRVVADVADHETRLRVLERIAWRVLGAAFVGSALSGIAIDLAGRWFHHVLFGGTP